MVHHSVKHLTGPPALNQRERLVMLLATGRPLYCLCALNGRCCRHATIKGIPILYYKLEGRQ
jgi:hypothetical protein